MELFENENFKIFFKNEILYVIYLAEHIDLKMIDEGINQRLKITGDKEYKMVSDIRKVKSFSREARQRIAEKDAGVGLSKVAILSDSKMQEILFNFFNSIYKSPSPAKMFDNEKKALQWLNEPDD